MEGGGERERDFSTSFLCSSFFFSFCASTIQCQRESVFLFPFSSSEEHQLPPIFPGGRQRERTKEREMAEENGGLSLLLFCLSFFPSTTPFPLPPLAATLFFPLARSHVRGKRSTTTTTTLLLYYTISNLAQTKMAPLENKKNIKKSAAPPLARPTAAAPRKRFH